LAFDERNVLGFAGDGTHYPDGREHCVLLFDAVNLVLLREFGAHRSFVASMYFCPQKKILYTGGGRVKMWSCYNFKIG
tara:strand:+ start:850 stop:1083 length:234 start_codon:yes stop_codon:yes gene_type:complete